MKEKIKQLKNYLLLIAVSALLLSCSSTKPPVLISTEIKPHYPEEAQEKGIEGEVKLHLYLTKEGIVKIAKVHQTSGYDILDSAATEYGKKLRFKPAERDGRPISVLLSWDVTYDALTAFFQPKEYAAKIKDYYEMANNSCGSERDEILDKILAEHQRYVNYSRKNPLVNYNKHMKLFLTTKVANQWAAFFEDLPLRFIVYHDFLERFPESKQFLTVKQKMIDLLKEDIDRIKFLSKSFHSLARKQNQFISEIYRYLSDNFPDSLTGKYKTEANRYLQ